MKTQATATRKIRGIGSSQLAEALATLMGAVAEKNPERGRRIQKLRKLAGYSSAQKLAGHLNVSVRTVQYWEAGHEIGGENLPRLARALKAKPHEIDPPSSALLTATIEQHEEDEGLGIEDVQAINERLDRLETMVASVLELLTPEVLPPLPEALQPSAEDPPRKTPKPAQSEKKRAASRRTSP